MYELDVRILSYSTTNLPGSGTIARCVDHMSSVDVEANRATTPTTERIINKIAENNRLSRDILRYAVIGCFNGLTCRETVVNRIYSMRSKLSVASDLGCTSFIRVDMSGDPFQESLRCMIEDTSLIEKARLILVGLTGDGTSRVFIREGKIGFVIRYNEIASSMCVSVFSLMMRYFYIVVRDGFFRGSYKDVGKYLICNAKSLSNASAAGFNNDNYGATAIGIMLTGVFVGWCLDNLSISYGTNGANGPITYVREYAHTGVWCSVLEDETVKEIILESGVQEEIPRLFFVLNSENDSD